MKIDTLIYNCKKPALYAPSPEQMWADPHISKKLLEVHLNPDVDLASRKASTIDRTVEWVLSKKEGNKLDVLDLGCGPGLYTEKLADKGHEVTGVDISANSIDYARRTAQQKGVRIKYLNQNYLSLDVGESRYDIIVMIYTDFGVLLPKERQKLLTKVHDTLKPGGVFIFDVVNDKKVKERVTPKSWECSEAGFWSSAPYLCLSESFCYTNEKVVLYQHSVVNSADEVKIYRFWTKCFSNNELQKLLVENNFKNAAFYDDVLPVGDIWSGENVTFVVVNK